MQPQPSARASVKPIGAKPRGQDEDNINSLLKKVKSYNSKANLPLLKKAIKYCQEWHGAQKRSSGEPYYTHPLAVAHILADRKMDLDSVITGLLHDVVEDTHVGLEELAGEFSDDIANLVDGVTKLTDLEKESLEALREAGGKFKAISQTANYRKMFIAISHDARVLFVKLADRLHNMRTLGGIKSPEKRNRIARETLMIYAPLAERIGVYRWKSELQDLSFRQLNSRAYKEIETHLEKVSADGSQLEGISKSLQKLLRDNNIKAEVMSRLKSPASIWQKMEKRGIALTQLADIMAFRIVVEDIPQCYEALGIIHEEYKSFFSGFRDYISSPKPNGYQSLHTVVAGPEKQLVEIQIRTKKIHDDLENGIASHWRYKSGDDNSKKPKQSSTAGQLAWLRDMMERLERLEENPETAMQGVKLDLYQDQVFCLTPKHDIISLREGAVLLDFAYAVHTEIGHKCTGGLVNGRKQPLNHVLQNGDRIEITTSKTQTPHESWQQVAQTHHARSALQHYFKNRNRQQTMTLGKNRLEKFFKHQNAKLSDEILEHAIKTLEENKTFNRKANSKDNLFLAVGNMEIEPEEVLFAAHPGHNEKLMREWKKKTPAERFLGIASFLSKDGALIVNHPDTEFALNFASCCHPVAGDKITGIKTFGVGVTLHRADCPALHNVIAMQERWVEAVWDERYYGKNCYLGRLEVTMTNNPGALGRACNAIGEADINIGNLNFSKRVSDYYMMIFDLEVSDLAQLQKGIAALDACSDVHKVVRV